MAGERYGDKMETIHDVRDIEIVNGRLLLSGAVPPTTTGGVRLPAFFPRRPGRTFWSAHSKTRNKYVARIPRRRSPSSAESVPRKFLYI